MIRAVHHGPHIVRLAFRAALAAGLAWWVVRPLDGVLEDYRYYAPLGAVVAMSATVMRSVRSSSRAVAAIAVGAALALGVMALPLPEVAGLMVVVALGVAVGCCHWLGERGSWVAVTALFVLLVGGRDPWHYALAYAGLTAFGALIGVGVNVVMPAVPRSASSVKKKTSRPHERRC